MKLSSRALFLIASTCTLLLLVGSLFINLNGEFPHLGPGLSKFLILSLFFVGFVSAIWSAAKDRRRRIFAFIIGLVLLVLAWPAFVE